MQKKNGENAEGVCQPAKPMEVTPEVTPMEVDTPRPKEKEAMKEQPAATTTTPKKKKKKKTSYKNMMAGMMKSSSPARDVEKEKESLRKVTGGGAFSKIDKI